ncbi:MAG: NAD(P)H-dependent glycerol-3-phosphate dehydrogenase [Prevotellaceae bacterium]|jgi:glycerol-3-phosphate dehydrogenase (NAD(P)+)|nr:NAD(P)H-dependent glycerol-3-phosphate dehydrogenase [Prevotellaceae bacterium]
MFEKKSFTTPRFAMIGNGSWATALVKLLQNHEDLLYWFVRDEKMIPHIQRYRHNPQFLRAATLDPSRLEMTADINAAVEPADVVVVCIPSAFLSEALTKLTVTLKNKFIVSAVKGIIPEGNLTVAEYFNRRHLVSFDNIGVLSGPSHAEEIALERLTYLTFACKRRDNAQRLAAHFACHYVKTRVSTDIYGMEYAAILKNIYAIATGIAHSLGYGDNFLAVLVTNAQREMKRFLNDTRHSASRDTTHSPYLGDLLVTCYSQFSRNRTFGAMIGKGYSVTSAQAEMNMIAEGYYASRCIFEINAAHKINMPIADAVYRILYENASPENEMRALTDEMI